MKSMVYIVIGILVFSGVSTLGMGDAGEKQSNVRFSFSEPMVVDKEAFVEVRSEGTNAWILNAGNPMLPIRVETLVLPFGATIQNIICEVSGAQTKVLSKKVMPAPQPMRLNDNIAVSGQPQMKQEIYDSESLFPNDWMSYHVGAGLDQNNQHKTFLTINTYPVRYEPGSDMLHYAQTIDVTVTYKAPQVSPFPLSTEYDLVIIAPQKFSSALQPLVDHKIAKGVSTTLKTTEVIYDEYTGYDKPEQIKYFIMDALETWNTSYVLLVGGLNSLLYAKGRDNVNEGSKDWYVPVRYSNLDEGEPGYISDLYYADVYNDTGGFCNWDSNGNHIYAEFKLGGDKLDLYPDVALGRLSCRNTREVNAVVDKIIHYESGPADPSWFNKMVLVSGDGFLDQEDLDISWNTNALSNGAYTIYAQSTNNESISGPIDMIHVTIDKTKPTTLTFNHDDHLITGLNYPFPPVAEIVSVSEGDILGNTDYSYTPTEREAYLNDQLHWANLQYSSGILKIRGKTYDPRPYGVETSIHVWVNNSGGTTVFDVTKTGYKMYYEGEWTTGEQLLLGRAGAAYYMPYEFQKTFLWSSNGQWTGQTEVIDTISEGAGFVFFSGHGSPAVWSNHYPGIPGNRKNAEVKGLFVLNIGLPVFPMDKISNPYKNPVVVVGGCHNSMFNVSTIPTLLDTKNLHMTHSYGFPTAECWSERFVRLPKKGAIATMGNTGYGYGILNEYCTVGGLDNYITTEFFVQYGTHGRHVLGEAYAGTLTEYISHFKGLGEWDVAHQKTVEQWVLLGDPSLLIGGYPS
ncbi:MAG TPA: C25 family cysteine peptidase [Candidatus Thermoplasmatota archaeon]|nr:C25 family cysteine peptidase [Candidatus Thermoplasmatota archaeon]